MAVANPKIPPASDLDAAIGGVRRGRELAAQLVAVLRRIPGQHDGLDEAGELAEEALAAFSKALSALDSGDSAESAVAQPPSPEPEKRKTRPAVERRRGQTRRSQPYAWTKVSARTLEDGHTWRKYGQKEIHGAKYPRCYFRCTHKHDQGCQATRQVQKSEDDPSMFVITYLGNHTCKKPILSGAGEPFLISFSGGRDPGLQAAFPRQRETEEDALSSQVSRNDSCSSPEYLMLPELTPLESSVPVTGISSPASDVAGDVTSGFLGVDFQFEDMLGLQHDDLNFVYF